MLLLLPLTLLAACGSTAPSSAPLQASPAPSSPSSPVSAEAAVPPGFTAQDLTFVSPAEGWLLGTAPCAAAPCTSIVHTTDGGRTWAGIPAPKAALEPDGQSGCGTDPCVRGLRFADAEVGFAYGSSAWYRTGDAGRTWTRLPGQASAVEVAGGTVLRVSTTSDGCPPGCTYQISWGSLDARTFTPATVTGGTQLIGNNVQLLRTGHSAFLELFANPAGGAESAHARLLTSADDGHTWTVREDPCGTVGGKESDSYRMAVADDGSLSILCRQRDGGGAGVVTSTDGGARFGGYHQVAGDVAIGAASAGTLVVAGPGTLLRTTDGGASWSEAGEFAVPPGDPSGSVTMGFQNATTGRFTPGGGSVLSTTDAGRTWTTVSLR